MDTYRTALEALCNNAPLPEGMVGVGVILAFATVCAAAGLLVVLVDLIVHALHGRSPLGLAHGARNTLLLVLFWSFGAGAIGALGQYASVLQTTALASLSVGLAWPAIFTQWLQKEAQRAREQEDEQIPAFEEA